MGGKKGNEMVTGEEKMERERTYKKKGRTQEKREGRWKAENTTNTANSNTNTNTDTKLILAGEAEA